MIRRSSFVFALGALVLSASAAEAQATCGNTALVTATCTPAGTQVSVTVNKIVRLTVTPTSGSLTAPTDVDFTAGGTVNKDDANLQTLLVRANVAWALTATASPWTAPYAKAIGDASFSITGGFPFTAFTGASQSVTTGSASAGATVNLSYRVSWSLTADLPGVYTLPVAFTVSST